MVLAVPLQQLEQITKQKYALELRPALQSLLPPDALIVAVGRPFLAKIQGETSRATKTKMLTRYILTTTEFLLCERDALPHQVLLRRPWSDLTSARGRGMSSTVLLLFRDGEEVFLDVGLQLNWAAHRALFLSATSQGFTVGSTAISAASASASVPATAAEPPGASDLVRDIERLQALHTQGALTDDEFTAAKPSVLARPRPDVPQQEPAAPVVTPDPAQRAAHPAPNRSEVPVPLQSGGTSSGKAGGVAVAVGLGVVALLFFNSCSSSSLGGSAGDGTFAVPSKMAPGLYHTETKGGCYFARLNSLESSGTDSIIVNQNVLWTRDSGTQG